MDHSHHHDDAVGRPSELVVCPVMGVKVNKQDAKAKDLVRTVGGKTHYLCCNTCATQFDTNPDKYSKDD